MGSPTNVGVWQRKAWGAVAIKRYRALFFEVCKWLAFLNILFKITSCTKSLFEPSESKSSFYTFNHCAKDSKKTKQLFTEIL